MLRAAVGLLRASGRVLLEMAPEGVDVDEIGNDMARDRTSRGARPARLADRLLLPLALGAHARRGGCRLPRRPPRSRADARGAFGIEHTTLQVEHAQDGLLQIGREPVRETH